MSATATGRQLTVAHLAEAVGGTAEGELERPITDVQPFEAAGPQDLTFVAQERFEQRIAGSQAGCVLVRPGIAMPPGRTVIRHDAPYIAFARAIPLLRPTAPPPPLGTHPSAVIAPDAQVDPTASVGPGAVIEARAVVGAGAAIGALAYIGHDARVGEGSLLHPRATVAHGVTIGRRCIIHAGAVIGADGFGYAQDPQTGEHIKIPQVGTVILEDDVEVGANTTIDRAVLDATRIGRGTKIDNLVQIAHNVETGPGCVIVAQAGISGSTRLGAGVVIAAQAGIVGHIKIGDRAVVAASAGVTKDVPPKEAVLGQPAVPMAQGKRAYALIGRLPEMKKAIAALDRSVRRLEERCPPAPDAAEPPPAP